MSSANLRRLVGSRRPGRRRGRRPARPVPAGRLARPKRAQARARRMTWSRAAACGRGLSGRGSGFLEFRKTGLGEKVGSGGAVVPSGSEPARISAGGTSFTGTVCGFESLERVGRHQVGGGTASAQGVLQVCPVEVLTSAPAGSDSNCKVVVGVADFSASDPDAHPATVKPHARMARTRRMAVSRCLKRLAGRPRPTETIRGAQGLRNHT